MHITAKQLSMTLIGTCGNKKSYTPRRRSRLKKGGTWIRPQRTRNNMIQPISSINERRGAAIARSACASKSLCPPSRPQLYRPCPTRSFAKLHITASYYQCDEGTLRRTKQYPNRRALRVRFETNIIYSFFDQLVASSIRRS